MHSQNGIIDLTEASAKTLKLALLSEHVNPQVKYANDQTCSFSCCVQNGDHTT